MNMCFELWKLMTEGVLMVGGETLDWKEEEEEHRQRLGAPPIEYGRYARSAR